MDEITFDLPNDATVGRERMLPMVSTDRSGLVLAARLAGDEAAELP